MDDKSSSTIDVEEPVSRARRTRVLLGGYAAFNQEHSAVPCVIRDLSESGARVEFDLGWIVPSHFVLFVDLEGFKVECEKVWHQGKLYGLRFTGPRIATERARRQHIDLYKNVHEAPSETVARATDPTPGRKVNRPAFGKLR
jgi:hypothetical protein